jgi:hypothetical protein
MRAETTEDWFVYRNTQPLLIVGGAELSVAFNVYDGLPVRERLLLKQYKIWRWDVEATFDREYSSAMARSPDHMIFLTAMVHLQRMAYIWICCELAGTYEAKAPEKFKIWPITMNCSMPRMVRNSVDVIQTLKVVSFDARVDGSYLMAGVSTIGGGIRIDATAGVFPIDRTGAL